ncbi:stage 0 sporulation family protein [Bacillus badius]|uniref:Signal peptidase-like protein n=1 Tax=Bacillus badius TaxID=1455 RepID=A0ABR5API3_BACBA|nr:stage 0 sporulation family protein [Bacillus badius]KIL71983.1 Signal peptidase-like protein [Bacillus badius]KIL75739.1 Signal peptidase-like protein [Bacillus badius]KZO00945.1 stage 0 sporulation protein [Bacillus badius]KZR56721.1 stage 0 sporulation protein [Bacillus badius]MED0667660.1 stage 0 sporulation family protein [Bacillus badius]
MYDVVGVRFKKAGKIYYFDPMDLGVEKNDHVIVETARGVEHGEVVVGPKKVEDDDIVLPLKKVIRKADQKDRLIVEENKAAAAEAFDICCQKITEHKLDMKLVDVEYTFDRNKVIFYFTADGRVDFRELVKDLAAIFRTRIELRQIGVRDEAKMLGGIGPCGRMLCCSTFLGDFEPVSIKMAKDQNLSLNPTKISGLCGRLMCCLKYENDEYEAAKELLPDVGTKVNTPHGAGKVIGLNILERVLQVEVFNHERILEFTIDEIGAEGAVSVQATE